MSDQSTLGDVRRAGENRAAVLGRRIAIALMALVVVFGLTGFLGVKARTIRASGGGYAMTLTYPQVARAGLDVPWRLTIHHPGGFRGDITIAVSNRYWDIFEFQGLHPSPSDETATSGFVYLTFSPPPASDSFSVSLDTYVQPSSQVGRSATTKLIIAGETMAEVHYKTWLVP